MKIVLFGLALFLGLASALPAQAGEVPTYTLEIRARGFHPSSLLVPAGTRIRLRIHNLRTRPAEFESYALNREKILPPGATLTVWIGPLEPGKYPIFDDFNPAARGLIIATRKASAAKTNGEDRS